jgi:uncharacterized membrane protein (UPF0136 family)
VDGDREGASVVPFLLSVGEGVLGWVDSVSRSSLVVGKSVGFFHWVGSENFRLDGEEDGACVVTLLVLSLLSSSSTGRSASGTAIPTTRTATIKAIHRTFKEDLPLALDGSVTLESSISQSLFDLFTNFYWVCWLRAGCIVIITLLPCFMMIFLAAVFLEVGVIMAII